ncbi:MAG: hypothetical protein ACT4N8_00190 [Sphingosinicella sp.]|uniref:hypothetical protein n=1 Tax=Sphingosinicella sp. TaxID=1917971 RepID=UPI00403769FC
MTSYRGQIEGILSLGPNIWSAEYKFGDQDRAAAAAQIVSAGVPEIVRLAQSKQANMVVGEFDDAYLLFVGGLMSNEAFAVAHTFVTSAGGEFLNGSMPGGKAMLSEAAIAELNAIGVEPVASKPSDEVQPRIEEPTAFDRLVADIEEHPERYARTENSSGSEPKSGPWWRFWGP